MSSAAPATDPRFRKSYRLARMAVFGASWLTLIAILVAWGLLRLGDSWWLGTLLMFSPRWVFAAPAAGLLLAGAGLRQRSAIPAAIALTIALGPVMGACIPWQPLVQAPPSGIRLRVMTCNMHHGKVNPELLDSLLHDVAPDVVALQEWRDSARSKTFEGEDWHVVRASGLYLASRYPILLSESLGANSTGPQGLAMRYELDTPGGVVTVFSLHLDSPREGIGEVRSGGLDRLKANSEVRGKQSEYLAAQASHVVGPLLLMGDFNTPPDSVLFRRIWGDYSDAFGEAGLGWGYTFFIRRTRVRIDHILVGGSGEAISCWVGPDVGSPHRPVIADVAWPTRITTDQP